MTLEIEARDVVKIVLQFCKERSLHQSFQTLQNDRQVSLNGIQTADKNGGRWETILPQVAQLKQTQAMSVLKQEQPERYLRQEDLLFCFMSAFFSAVFSLAAEVNVVPPSRLMTLIGQALKWQQHQGMAYKDWSMLVLSSMCTFPGSHSLAFSSDGSQLLSASVDNTARVN
ncbi:hypothetical protein DKX38_026222 [Salix brachista]|uniref:TPL/SMU1 LisH-like dimerisation domain-containing protein n=1 Tax=Salix brachista TaxID=2182728 RepID=A0A5N5JW41_9ROSI|nr:hypothetical protein DKX38_026222 [Salix brachista]